MEKCRGGRWKRAGVFLGVVFSGGLVGYWLPDFGSKIGFGAENSKVLGGDECSLPTRNGRRPSASIGIENLKLGPAQNYLISQLLWVPAEEMAESMRIWKDLLVELSADGAGEYAYDSLALVVFDEMARRNPESLFDQLLQSENLHFRTNQLKVLFSAWEQTAWCLNKGRCWRLSPSG